VFLSAPPKGHFWNHLPAIRTQYLAIHHPQYLGLSYSPPRAYNSLLFHKTVSGSSLSQHMGVLSGQHTQPLRPMTRDEGTVSQSTRLLKITGGDPFRPHASPLARQRQNPSLSKRMLINNLFCNINGNQQRSWLRFLSTNASISSNPCQQKLPWGSIRPFGITPRGSERPRFSVASAP
jgi:hypothetical protein